MFASTTLTTRSRAPRASRLAGLAGVAASLLCAASAQAAALKIVHVGAPAVNCLFDPSCTITPSDSVGTFPLAGAVGTAKLQTRTVKAKAGTPAAGRTIYMYRLDLRQAVGVASLPCVKNVKVAFGAPSSTIDYDKDGVGGDQVFVISSGGSGTIAPTAAVKTGSTIDFQFATPVCAGAAPGGGESSFFFGLASALAPAAVNATVIDTANLASAAPARAPKLLSVRSFGGSFLADLGTR